MLGISVNIINMIAHASDVLGLPNETIRESIISLSELSEVKSGLKRDYECVSFLISHGCYAENVDVNCWR